MKGMISTKSREYGVRIQCKLIVDNAAPDSESFHTECDETVSLCSVDLALDSVSMVGTTDMTPATSAAIEENNDNLNLSEDHIRMLRWSASMGDRRALAELKAVEDKIAERDSIEYQNKLRWCAAMGDAASIAKLNSKASNSRWSAGCEKEEPKNIGSSKRSLMKPKRRSSFRLPKLSLR